MKHKVLLDIDGVIAAFYFSFADYLNSKYGTRLDLNVEAGVYNIYEWEHNLSRDTIDNAIAEWMLDGGFFNMPIYSGAKKFTYSIMDKYDVYIVTARIGDFKLKFSEDVANKIMNDTRNWFKKHGIPFDKMFFRHDKVNFCKENDIKILIEDKLSTVVDGVNNGIYSILMSRPWNEKNRDVGLKGNYAKNLIYVANNYDDILRYLEEINGQ